MKGKNKTYQLKGLSCARCASKIEDGIQKIGQVAKARVNFATSTLNIELDHTEGFDEITKNIRQVVKAIEAHVEVVETTTHLEENPRFFTKKRWLLLAGIILFAGAILSSRYSSWSLVLYMSAYIIIGGDVLGQAARNIIKGKVFDENFLMSIATIGAIIIKEYPEAVAVMLFYRVGEEFQEAAVNRSRSSIKTLLNIKPDKANLMKDSEIIIVDPQKVEVGDILLVRPGERIPLDGIVIDGVTQLDTSALTGEAIPRRIEPGDKVYSGAINITGVFQLEVLKREEESTAAKILDLVQNASEHKAPTEKFITKFARVYTPAVVLAALLVAVIPPLFIAGAVWGEWLYRALIFLVISCPCALVISIPLSFFGGIGGASRRGILVKSGNYLEALNGLDTIVLDKTGTLTRGVFEVVAINPQPHLSVDDILYYAAHAEAHSSHPIAKSIVNAFKGEVNFHSVNNIDEMSGRGVKAIVDEKRVLVGSRKLIIQEGVVIPQEDFQETVIHIVVEDIYAGYILVRDELRDGAKEAVALLRKLGMKRLVVLSGDREAAVKATAQALGIDEYYSELLPQDKVEKIEQIGKGKKAGKIAFVGDGINDAPVLARADIGIAMGGIGSDTAIEAADVVLMTDEPMKIVEAITIARKTRRIVLENIIIALSIKGFVLILGVAGVATLWEAVFADVGAALLAVLNAMRVLKIRA